MSGYEILRKQLAKESKIVASDSIAVLEEFEKFEESLPGGHMKSFRKELWFEVPTRRAFINITSEVEEYVKESGVKEGLVLVNTKTIYFISLLLFKVRWRRLLESEIIKCSDISSVVSAHLPSQST